MLKISLRLKKLHGTSQIKNLRILRIKNAKFSGYCFYMNTTTKEDFQICISVPLKDILHLQHFFNNEQLNFEPPLYCIVLLYPFASVQKPVQTHINTDKKD